MHIYFMRHGKAEEHRAGLADSDRRLTPEGEARIRSTAKTFLRMGLKVDAIISSPLKRAWQTARIVSEAYGESVPLSVDARLAYGGMIEDYQDIVNAHPEANRVLLVGHNPDFSAIPGALTGGSRLEVKPGGLSWVETEKIERGAGTLIALLQPSILAMDSDEA